MMSRKTTEDMDPVAAAKKQKNTVVYFKEAMGTYNYVRQFKTIADFERRVIFLFDKETNAPKGFAPFENVSHCVFE